MRSSPMDRSIVSRQISVTKSSQVLKTGTKRVKTKSRFFRCTLESQFQQNGYNPKAFRACCINGRDRRPWRWNFGRQGPILCLKKSSAVRSRVTLIYCPPSKWPMYRGFEWLIAPPDDRYLVHLTNIFDRMDVKSTCQCSLNDRSHLTVLESYHVLQAFDQTV